MACESCGRSEVVETDSGRHWCRWCNDWAEAIASGTPKAKTETTSSGPQRSQQTPTIDSKRRSKLWLGLYATLLVLLVIVPTSLFHVLRSTGIPSTAFAFIFFGFAAAPICWGFARALLEHAKPVPTRMAGLGIFVQFVICILFLLGFLAPAGAVSLLAAFSCLALFAIDIFVGLLYFLGFIKNDSLIDRGYNKVRGD